MYDVVVIGAGPAGLEAARRAGELGASTAIVEKEYLGGMGTNDGPVPVRTLAHAARLLREATHLERYGIDIPRPKVNYGRLLERVRAVVEQVHGAMNAKEVLGQLGVTLYERAGEARFVDPHTIETGSGMQIRAKSFIVCAGGHSRGLPVPGGELVATHSDAWSLTEIPESMVVVGAGATGVQVASIFNDLGSRVTMVEVAPRILMTEDIEVSQCVASAYRGHGVKVLEGVDGIDAIERKGEGFRFHYRYRGEKEHEDTSIVVLAIGWSANAPGLNLSAAGIETNARGYIEVNDFLQTTAPHIYAAGDILGKTMLVPSAVQEGYCAATNAVTGEEMPLRLELVPIGSFTDPEYARVGLTEEQAREGHDCVVSVVRFDEYPRSIIDGRTTGFCKIIADRESHSFLGAHVVGERAVETVQMVAAGMAAGLTIEQLNRIPLSFPTYVGIVGWAVFDIAKQLGIDKGRSQWEPHRILV